jgi:diacylglycerol kinase (CTP)
MTHGRAQQTWNGVIWYLLGVIFSLSAYPLDIAVVSILM